MPLANFVHVDTVSKHQLAITATYIGFAMNKRQRLRTYQLPCVQYISSHRFSYLNSDKLMSSKRILQVSCSIDQGCIQASRVMRPVQNRMYHSRQKYLRSQQTYRLVLDFWKLIDCVCIGTQAVFTAKHAFYGCFLLGSLLWSREIFTQVQTFNCTGRLRTACTKRFLVPQHLEICESNPWTNKIV